MLIPQGMAYALIAGLPPIYGLYASLVPIIGYALFGSSRQLAVGPVAMVSLLIAAGIAPLAAQDSADYVRLAIILALMVGAIQFLLGAVRFGFLVNFLSHPVLSGFTSAAALIIGASQLKNLLGIDIPRSNYVHEIVWSALRQAADTHVITLVIGLVSIGLLVGLRKWKRTFPSAILVVLVTTAFVWLTAAHEAGVAIVGSVPQGLPSFGLPAFSMSDVSALAPTAMVIALVGFMESIAVAKAFAARNRYRVDPNQELVGLGIANLAGAFFQAFPTTGGFSRTAVNGDAGARTTMASIISAAVIALTLLFLTPLFYYMPNAVLAAVIIVAVAGLVDFREAVFLWKVDRRDFWLLVLTFLATLALGIEEGILVGVIASLVVVVYQSSRPYTAVLGKLPDTTTYKNLSRNPTAVAPEGIMILRIDASLYFANSEYVKDRLEGAGPEIEAVVLDMYPVNKLDSSALHTLAGVLDVLEERHVVFLVSGVKGPIRDVMRRAGLEERLGEASFYSTIHDAVEVARHRVLARAAAEVVT
jgi:SulP family sulfate permease